MDANSSRNGTDLANQLISMKLPALFGSVSKSVFRSKLAGSELDKRQGLVFV